MTYIFYACSMHNISSIIGQYTWYSSSEYRYCRDIQFVFQLDIQVFLVLLSGTYAIVTHLETIQVVDKLSVFIDRLSGRVCEGHPFPWSQVFPAKLYLRLSVITPSVSGDQRGGLE